MSHSQTRSVRKLVNTYLGTNASNNEDLAVANHLVKTSRVLGQRKQTAIKAQLDDSTPTERRTLLRNAMLAAAVALPSMSSSPALA